MKKIISLSLILLSYLTYGQEVKPAEKNWHNSGNISIMFNQASFDNWLKGGENSLALNGLFNHNFNYKKNKSVWDTKLFVAYGLSKINSITKKTDDRFEINSVYGYEASKEWYYSFFTNFKTQMTDGFDYSATPNVTTSRLFAPAYLDFGPGMLWKKSDNLRINFAPVASKITFVLDDTLSAAGAYGVEPGKHLKYGAGMAVNAYYKFDLMKNVSMENILNLYSDYLDHPENIDVDYQMNMVMTVNKYISANLGINLLYDDNALADLQFKEVFGIGFNAKL
ncbi:MAG TPA: DUF3078 domain-containing protein [Flavobacteriales bacterium]|nr:DUF3078 domain-containing protein [Flavobacteriales bacterium]